MNHAIKTVLMVALLAAAVACRPREAPPVPSANQSADVAGVSASDVSSSPTERAADLATTPAFHLNVPKASLATLGERSFRRQRLDMVERQIASPYGDGRTPVQDKRVLEAMRWV
ncbi:hypothetical protein FJY63_03355, partial [Candidatus Sumerlaeota bacterium]|nr:hypothetical protein [Candidatus Sumerlaeota bacterium]